MPKNRIVCRKWKVVMERGIAQRDFSCGFPSQKAAMDYAELLGWHCTDQEGFDWCLAVTPDVKEMEQTKNGRFQNVKR